MYYNLCTYIYSTGTKRSTALKASQDKAREKTDTKESNDPEEVRKQIKDQEEIRFLEYFRSPPCKLCGMNDHNMIKRTTEPDGHYTEEYECPVASNSGSYDRSIGPKIFEMSDEKFLNHYGYNEEAVVMAYREFTIKGAGSRIPSSQRQLRLQNLINLCVKEREKCSSIFKSVNKLGGHEDENDDDDGDDESHTVNPILTSSTQEISIHMDNTSLKESRSDKNSGITRSSKRARTDIDYNEDKPPPETELFENCFDSLITYNEPGMGIGVISTRRISRGVLLGEYTGTIKTLQEVIDRTELDPPYYIVATETADHFIDGENLGNILKYINHKCIDPNCRLVNLTPTRVGIQTRKTIQPNEKLNYNYNLVYPEGSVVRRIKCVCTPECQHYL
jgi:hypothetical protein